ncbi:hypothetical protein AAMO2058_001588900 [Amorphochlora amoebiformis]
MGTCCQGRDTTFALLAPLITLSYEGKIPHFIKAPPPLLEFTIIARVINYAGLEDFSIDVTGLTTVKEMKAILQKARGMANVEANFEVSLLKDDEGSVKGEILNDDNTVGYYGILESEIVVFHTK